MVGRRSIFHRKLLTSSTCHEHQLHLSSEDMPSAPILSIPKHRIHHELFSLQAGLIFWGRDINKLWKVLEILVVIDRKRKRYDDTTTFFASKSIHQRGEELDLLRIQLPGWASIHIRWATYASEKLCRQALGCKVLVSREGS